MKLTVSAKRTLKSNGSSTKRRTPPAYVVCVKSGGYVDLEPLKVYKLRHDPDAKAQGLLRVVDGSGEDYLFPSSYFRKIQAPQRLFQMVEG